VAAGEDAARVSKGQLLEGVEENLFGLRGGVLGGAVHADFEDVHRIALAEQTHGLADGLEFRREENSAVFVKQESVGPAGEGDGLAGAEFESLLETGGALIVAEAGGGVYFLECVVALGCGISAAAER